MSRCKCSSFMISLLKCQFFSRLDVLLLHCYSSLSSRAGNAMLCVCFSAVQKIKCSVLLSVVELLAGTQWVGVRPWFFVRAFFSQS